uniref:Uncharacterized protein n=1 Tax=Salix viminalis TaxID=40686 RepID=A0A6N2N1K1_SALVM
MCNCFGWCSTVFQGHDVLRWQLENGSSPVLTKVINFLVAVFLPQELMLQSTQLQVVKKVKQNAGIENFSASMWMLLLLAS